MEHRSSRLRRWNGHWVGLCAVILATLLAGCAPLAGAQTPRRAAPTPTLLPLPPAPLQWRAASFPPGLTGLGYSVAESDGATAYVCSDSYGSGESFQTSRVWITHDFAAHWSQVSSIPADHFNSQCDIKVDRGDSRVAVAIFSWINQGANHPNASDMSYFVTFDSGASWRKLVDAQQFEMSLLVAPATVNGMTYAIRSMFSGNVAHNGLWVSSDQMRTWRLIGPTGEYKEAQAFWLGPTSGEMLAEFGGYEEQSSLWESHDGGSHWTQLTTPPTVTFGQSVIPFLARAVGPGRPWTICSADDGAAETGQLGNAFRCSLDEGKTWKTRPAIPRTPGVADSAQQIERLADIASDGSLLAVLPDGSAGTLYRLLPSASQWQSLGEVPIGPGPTYYSPQEFVYAPNPGAGVFWQGAQIATYR